MKKIRTQLLVALMCATSSFNFNQKAVAVESRNEDYRRHASSQNVINVHDEASQEDDQLNTTADAVVPSFVKRSAPSVYVWPYDFSEVEYQANLLHPVKQIDFLCHHFHSTVKDLIEEKEKNKQLVKKIENWSMAVLVKNKDWHNYYNKTFDTLSTWRGNEIPSHLKSVINIHKDWGQAIEIAECKIKDYSHFVALLEYCTNDIIPLPLEWCELHDNLRQVVKNMEGERNKVIKNIEISNKKHINIESYKKLISLISAQNFMSMDNWHQAESDYVFKALCNQFKWNKDYYFVNKNDKYHILNKIAHCQTMSLVEATKMYGKMENNISRMRAQGSLGSTSLLEGLLFQLKLQIERGIEKNIEYIDMQKMCQMAELRHNQPTNPIEWHKDYAQWSEVHTQLGKAHDDLQDNRNHINYAINSISSTFGNQYIESQSRSQINKN